MYLALRLMRLAIGSPITSASKINQKKRKVRLLDWELNRYIYLVRSGRFSGLQKPKKTMKPTKISCKPETKGRKQNPGYEWSETNPDQSETDHTSKRNGRRPSTFAQFSAPDSDFRSPNSTKIEEKKKKVKRGKERKRILLSD